MDSSKGNEIIIYQPDETMKLKVRLENETVWLTQAQMAELFQSTRNNITLHIRNIFKEGELEENSVCKESLLTAADGKAYRTKFYNLDVIISVSSYDVVLSQIQKVLLCRHKQPFELSIMISNIMLQQISGLFY